MKLLNDKLAAEKLSVSVWTLRNWRKNKRGPKYIKMGSFQVRYADSDLDKYIEDNTITYSYNPDGDDKNEYIQD